MTANQKRKGRSKKSIASQFQTIAARDEKALRLFRRIKSLPAGASLSPREESERKYLAQRRRDFVGRYSDQSVRELLEPKVSLTSAAIRLILEHDFSLRQAVAAVLRDPVTKEVDPDKAEAFRGAVRQALPKARAQWVSEQIRLRGSEGTFWVGDQEPEAGLICQVHTPPCWQPD